MGHRDHIGCVASMAALGVVVVGLGCGGAGEPPVVAELGEQIAAVGEPLLLRIQASDPDGDALHYDFSSVSLPMLTEQAELLRTPDGQGLFSWTPLAADLGQHVVDFSVSDDTHTTVMPTSFDVRGAVGEGSQPEFVRPVGEGMVHNLADGPCVPPVEIEVADPDDAMVQLRQEAPVIAGAELSATGSGLEGLWEWCPDAQQRADAGIYELWLAADDGQNPPTIKRFSVWLQRAGEDCPSLPPYVDHAPAGSVVLLADPEIIVSAGDDVGLPESPVLSWSTERVPPMEMESVLMERVDGDATAGTYRVSLPNPAVPLGVGATASLYYRISAGDEDGCSAQSPADGLHQLVVDNPGGPGAEVCEPCSWDAQCGGDGDLCLQFGVDERGCGRACSGPADCDPGTLCSAEPLVSVEGVMARQCIPEDGPCASEQCEDDDHEPDDTLLQGLEGPALPEGLIEGRRLCSPDEDWYRIELGESARVLALLSGSAEPDMDLALTDDQGIVQAVAESSESEEDLSSACLLPGTYALRVYSLLDGAGDYQLSYVLDPGSC